MTTTTSTPETTASDSSTEASTTADPSPSTEPTSNPEQPPVSDEPDHPDEANPNKEAAKYRVRLREAEAERDAVAAERDELRSALTLAREAVVTEALRYGGGSVAALRAGGVELDELFTADGDLDRTATDRTMKRVARELGIPLGPGLGYVPTQGTSAESAPEVTWGAALGNR